MDSDFSEYQTLVAVEADSPSELVRVLKSIKAPFKILSFTSVGPRQCAYILEETRTNKPAKSKKG